MERQVIVAKSAGFCFGVERAVARVYEQIQAVKEGKAQGPIYTYGPICLLYTSPSPRDCS